MPCPTCANDPADLALYKVGAKVEFRYAPEELKK
jgi:hypothetical protein